MVQVTAQRDRQIARLGAFPFGVLNSTDRSFKPVADFPTTSSQSTDQSGRLS